MNDRLKNKAIIVIGALMGCSRHHEAVPATQANMSSLAAAINLFRIDRDRFPTNLEERGLRDHSATKLALILSLLAELADSDRLRKMLIFMQLCDFQWVARNASFFFTR